MPRVPSTPDSGGLRRELTLFDATMLVVGSVIGSGIFIVSADIARTVGATGWFLVVWAVSGIVTIIAALSYGELAGMMPQAGGQYVYLREAWNPLVAFLFGWTFFLVIQPGSIAAIAVAFAKFAAVLFPVLGERSVLFSLVGLDVSVAQLVAIFSIITLTWANMQGLRAGKQIQNGFTLTKTLALLGIVTLGIAIGLNAGGGVNLANFWQAAWTRVSEAGGVTREPLSGLGLLAALGVASVGSLFAFDAWNNVTFTAAETRNPRRTIALSLALGVGVTVVVYLLANLAYILLLPLTGDPNGADAVARGIQFAADDRVGTAAASMIFGSTAVAIMAVLVMVSTFGANNGMILSGARVYYAMAQDGLFFKRTGRLNRFAVPGWGLALQGLWAVVLCLSGKYGDLLDYVIFAVLIFYILTIAGIFRLRKKWPDVERPYKAFGYPVLPLIYIFVALAVCIDLLILKPRFTWPGMIIVLLGIPVYFLWRRRIKDNG